MKPILIKIPAMFAMFICLSSIIFYVLVLLNLVHHETWILSALLAMFSVPFFCIDAIISFVKARKKEDSKFNYILALVLIGSIPMVSIFAGSGRDFFNVIWNLYYVAMFILEVISIKKACAMVKANKKTA